MLGSPSSNSSDTPYSVFYKVGLDPDENPFSEDCPFKNEDGTPRFKAEDGLALMVDLDGDARSDFNRRVGVSEIKASDLILWDVRCTGHKTKPLKVEIPLTDQKKEPTL